MTKYGQINGFSISIGCYTRVSRPSPREIGGDVSAVGEYASWIDRRRRAFGRWSLTVTSQ